MTSPINSELIGFGGGCHWCTEAVFNSLNGIFSVEQGFIQSEPPDHFASEAVRISYDPTIIPLGVLIEIHLKTHSSTSNHTLRTKYRSAVYTLTEQQRRYAINKIEELEPEYDKPIVTRVLPLVSFIDSPERYKNYYQNHVDGEFCQRFIDPKLALLKRQFKDQVTTISVNSQ